MAEQSRTTKPTADSASKGKITPPKAPPQAGLLGLDVELPGVMSTPAEPTASLPTDPGDGGAASTPTPPGDPFPNLHTPQKHRAARQVNALEGNTGITRRITASNRASQPNVQAKLTVNNPGDMYEREADRIADQVMGSGGFAVVPPPGDPATDKQAKSRPSISRLATSSAPTNADSTAAPSSKSGFDLDNRASERLHTARRSGGDKLPRDQRRFFENRLGADLSNVRIHNNPSDHKLARDLRARAFTHQSDIFFAPGAYQPGSRAGQHLLAHELTHVVQQGAAPAASEARVQRRTDDVPEGHSADEADDRGPVTVNARVTNTGSSAVPTAQPNPDIEQAESAQAKTPPGGGGNNAALPPITDPEIPTTGGDKDGANKNTTEITKASEDANANLPGGEGGDLTGALNAATKLGEYTPNLQNPGEMNLLGMNPDTEQQENQAADYDNAVDRLKQFSRNISGKVTAGIQTVQPMKAEILQAAETGVAELQSQFSTARGQVTTAATTARGLVRGAARRARTALSGARTTTDAKIKDAASKARDLVRNTAKTHVDTINNSHKPTVRTTADTEFGTNGPTAFRASQDAVIAEMRKAHDEEAATLGAKNESHLNGFWNGYNFAAKRRDARLQAASATRDAFIDKIKENVTAAIGQLPSAKQDFLGQVMALLDSIVTALNGGRDNAIKAIDTAEKALLDSSRDAAEGPTGSGGFTKIINDTEERFLGQIAAAERKQIAQLNQLEQQEAASLRQAATGAAAQLEAAATTQANAVLDALQKFLAQFDGQPAPDYETLSAQIDEQESKLDEQAGLVASGSQGAKQSILSTITEQVGKTTSTLSQQNQLVVTAIEKFGTDADSAFSSIRGDIKKSFGDIAAKTTEIDKIATATKAKMDEQAGKINTNSLKTLVSGAITKAAADLKKKLKEVLPELRSGIKSNAEEAARKVPPRWKGWLKLLIAIVISIIVSVVIAILFVPSGGLSAMGGGAILMAVLGSAAVGAVGGVAQQLIFNAIDGESWSKDLGTAAVAGGISGVFSFFGGGVGKSIDAAFKAKGVEVSVKLFSSKVAADTAISTFGSTFVDSVIKGKELTWGLVGMNLLASFGASFASEGIGNIIKIRGAPKVDADATAPKIDADTGAPKVEVDTGTPKVDADGTAPKVDADGTAPKVDADGTAPKADADGTAPKADADGTAPKADAEGTAPKADAEGTAPKADNDGTAPKADEDTGAPKADADGTAPKADADGTAPKADADGTAPKADADTGAPKADADGSTPKTDADTGAPKADADTGAPKADAEVKTGGSSKGTSAGKGKYKADPAKRAAAKRARQARKGQRHPGKASHYAAKARKIKAKPAKGKARAEGNAPRGEADVAPPQADTPAPTTKVDADTGTPKADADTGAPKADADGTAPKADADTGAPKADTDGTAPKADADTGAPKADADGTAPKADADTGAPKADADGTAPKADADTGAPKADADGTAPKADADTGAPKADADGTAPKADADTGAPKADADGTAPKADADTGAPKAAAPKAEPPKTTPRGEWWGNFRDRKEITWGGVKRSKRDLRKRIGKSAVGKSVDHAFKYEKDQQKKQDKRIKKAASDSAGAVDQTMQGHKTTVPTAADMQTATGIDPQWMKDNQAAP